MGISRLDRAASRLTEKVKSNTKRHRSAALQGCYASICDGAAVFGVRRSYAAFDSGFCGIDNRIKGKPYLDENLASLRPPFPL